MLRGRSIPRRPAIVARWAAMALCTLLLTTGTALGQGSTTATIRGNVQDPSGGVLPGATVTVTNTGTKAVQTTVSDERGQYLFAGAVPGHLRSARSSSPGSRPTSSKGADAEPQRHARHRRAARSRPADRDDHGHRAAGSDSDRDRRARRRPEREADRQPVGHRPQRARTAAHPARRRHRLQQGRVGELRRRRQQHPELHRQRHPVVGQHRVARRLVAHRHRQQQRRDRVA